MKARCGAGLLIVFLLGACTAADHHCASTARAELRAIDARISESEHALHRGYRITPEIPARTTLHLCAWPREPVLFCTRHTPWQRQARIPIDADAEGQTLVELRAERARLARALADGQAGCSVRRH